MPLPLIYLIPVATGVLGFGGGFWAGSGVGKLVKLSAIGGGCYLAYRLVKEMK